MDKEQLQMPDGSPTPRPALSLSQLLQVPLSFTARPPQQADRPQGDLRALNPEQGSLKVWGTG